MVSIRIDAREPDPPAVQQAARLLLDGGLVAGPTDTFYGLLADPTHAGAVARLFRVKMRAAGQAVPLVAADLAQVERLAGRLDVRARRLAERFWPGALTLLVPAWPDLVPAVHGETGAVGIRVPAHPVARALAAAVGRPLVATSANLSGEPPPSRPGDISLAVREGIAALIDAGPCPGGLPSTIVDVRGDRPVLVRSGVVPWERVLESL